MLKINRKKWMIHGILFIAMLVSCGIQFQLIILWNLGYAVYFMSRLVIKVTRDLRPLFLKILTIVILTVGSAPCVVLMCIPAWLLCVIHSINHPDCGMDLPNYSSHGFELRNAAYYRDYNNYLFEGDIDENALKKAAFRLDWKFQEITKPTDLLYTAKSRIEARKNPSRPTADLKIADGLIYNSYHGTDCGELVVWDRKNKRLYFSSSLR